MKTANSIQVESGWTSNPPAQESKDHYACGFAPEGRPGQAYNEEAFAYFLALERKRSERSGRPFLLLVVELVERGGTNVPVDSKVAGMLFDALGPSLRETDFIGWYRTGRVIGAVLSQPGSMQGTGTSRVIHQRVGDVLQEELSPEVSSRVQVRVYELAARSVEQT